MFRGPNTPGSLSFQACTTRRPPRRAFHLPEATHPLPPWRTGWRRPLENTQAREDLSLIRSSQGEEGERRVPKLPSSVFCWNIWRRLWELSRPLPRLTNSSIERRTTDAHFEAYKNSYSFSNRLITDSRSTHFAQQVIQ